MEKADSEADLAWTFRVRALSLVVTLMIVCMVGIDMYKSRRYANSGWTPQDYVLDLNLATEAELNLLPGIGPKLSSEIIRYRETQGPFLAPEQIKEIPGIKGTRFEALKKHIVVQRQVESQDESTK